MRPFIDTELIEKVIAEASQTGAAIVGIVPVDTVKRVHKNKIRGHIAAGASGAGADSAGVPLRSAEARFRDAARDDSFAGTDEASLVERLEQVEVSVVQGSDRNIKITKPTDMDLARLFLAERSSPRS